ncbi:MAG: class I SAM-dependent methyltransferase [Fidelibacterota bacterium]|nr:MAG: class I SAM-dependent methyltransferase [Candidatus Neomarinimicrobiota bacterium]
MIRSVLQSLEEIEKWFEKTDPWGYEDHPSDQHRRALLLSLLPKKSYRKILDIGCGDGFITSRLPGEKVFGIDISENAIRQAREKCEGLSHISFEAVSLFDLPDLGWDLSFDLIILTGVLYQQYIAEGDMLAFTIINDLLEPGGHLVSCHIDEWCRFRFPYVTLHREYYSYREFSHILEVYLK